MVGRGLRTADGKADCLILDHSDNHIRLGFVSDIHHDKLDDGQPRPKAEPRAIEKLPKPCPKCTFLRPPQTPACPACGFVPVPRKAVTSKDGELIELAAYRKTKLLAEGERITFYSELRAIGQERGYEEGWASHQYRTKFGDWPRWEWREFPSLRPSATTRNWIKSRAIAFRKRRLL
jgi:superfamily II DNA or RNA helicase